MAPVQSSLAAGADYRSGRSADSLGAGQGFGMGNVDIFTPQDFLSTHKSFPKLLANDEIKQRFTAREDEANPAKRLYTRLGKYSLYATFITFTAVIFAVTLEPLFFPNPDLRPSDHWLFKSVLALLGIGGVAAQLYLLRGPLKDKWLDARFHAERLRSIKFQAFQEAARGGDAAVDGYTQTALGNLSVELGNITSARHNFRPKDRVLAPSSATVTLTSKQLDELKDAFKRLRIDVQTAFARGEIKRISEDRKLPAAASEISFWAGAALAYFDAVLAFFIVDPPIRAWFHFVTLELFVLSALLFVLERGRSYGLALERYEDYRDQMLQLDKQLELAGTADDFVACVAETERQALQELKVFCREAEKSTYLI